MYQVEEGEQLTLFPQGTREHANLLVLPGSVKAKKTTVTSGMKLLDFYKQSDPVGLLVKMLLGTSHWGSTECFLNWTVCYTPHKRLLYQLAPSTPNTEEIESLLLPTPTKSDSNMSPKDRFLGSPTYRSNFREAIRTCREDGTMPNPRYTEQVMGYPISWTELQPLETLASPNKSIPS